MGSLESGIPSKRDASSAGGRWGRQQPYLQRNRSRRLSRFFLFNKFNYIQLICSICVFFFFVLLFQLFLPSLVVDKSDTPPPRRSKDELLLLLLLPPDLVVFKESGVFDFGEDVRLEPSKLLMKFRRDTSDGGFNLTSSTQRFGFRKPNLALVTTLSTSPLSLFLDQ